MLGCFYYREGGTLFPFEVKVKKYYGPLNLALVDWLAVVFERCVPTQVGPPSLRNWKRPIIDLSAWWEVRVLLGEH